MKTLTIYFHPTEEKGRESLFATGRHNGKMVGYTRTEIKTFKDLGEALDNAKPRKGEIVLNTVECEL